MVKWKLGTIVLIVLLVSTYFTSQSKQPTRALLTINTQETPLTTLVFIHIQKTAGSAFERAIVRRLNFDAQPSCRCPVTLRRNQTRRPNTKLRCQCLRNDEPWLISRFSVGWLCGVHADWTTYHRCLPARMNTDYGFHQRKFIYATLLREPTARFVSEYLHTLRGATWLAERFSCSKAQQLRYQSACWKNTNLTDFILCEFNPAVNRQTRMLSSPLAPCRSPSFAHGDLIDLASAKRNLQAMEFFGLTEHLALSQRLFEQTSFCRMQRVCSFQSYLEQDVGNNQTLDYLETNVTSAERNQLRQINSDDVQLYDFAKRLFFARTCRALRVACD